VSALAWLRTRDPGLGALRRAARTAIVMPGMFALGVKVIGNPQVATFAAFGSFAMLLLVDFSGSLRQRFEAQVALGVVGAAFVCLGTLASHHAVVAAAAMAVVGLGVLFIGVVSSVFAGAQTSLLIAFILPVTTPAPTSAIPDRLAGWALATGAALIAVTVLWPAPDRNPLRTAAAHACRLLGDRLRAEAALSGSDAGPAAGDRDAADDRARTAVAELQKTFFGTPYRPTGLSSSARALVRLVDEVGWLSTIADHAGPAERDGGAQVCAVKVAVADVLAGGAALLEAPQGSGGDLGAELAHLRAALADMEYQATGSMPVATRDTHDRAQAVVSSLEPAFRAQEMSFAVSVIAANTERVIAAERRSWWARLLGHQPDGISGPLSAAHERAAAHVERHSVWLHNSLRGAAALAVAVLVADLTGVQHSFWVVLGTLSVLRSNALTTGQNALRGIVGTAGGFVVGGLLIAAVGTDTTLLWFLLPLAVLLAGLAPTTVSFAAGQGAFTLTLVILYNIIAPVGWHVGLTRIEDIALGFAVSLVVGLVFWPRGAAPALGRALAEAYADSAAYLRSAVAFGVQCCQPGSGAVTVPTREPRQAAASARRADDAFRSYLAERGSKRVPLATVTALITGVAGLRLAADAVLDLWTARADLPGDRSDARRELVAVVEAVSGWYDALGAALARTGPIPEPQEPDAQAAARLVDAIRRDLFDPAGNGTATAVRVAWTGDHVDAARRLETLLIEPARAALAGQ
jgi:uncharacterized membrane protein YccC